MNTLRFALLAGLALCLAVTGCGHLDVAPATSPNRVLTGTVTTGMSFPAGAEVSVKLFSPPSPGEALRPGNSDLPVVARASPPSIERVLGEFTQTLATPSTDPVPFKIEYFADETLLRRGLNLEARVSVGGKVKFRTVNAHVVTFGSAPFPQNVIVQPVDR